jgi:hypothetical protein
MGAQTIEGTLQKDVRLAIGAFAIRGRLRADERSIEEPGDGE